MEEARMPKPGEIYNHFKDKPYQIITVATQTETGELMVVYQALYGDFKTYVRPLNSFLGEVDRQKYPETKQKSRFEYRTNREPQEMRKTPEKVQCNSASEAEESITNPSTGMATADSTNEGSVNSILLDFLDASSYSKKLNVITGNMKHLNDRIINDMAVSLDCTVEEGPLENRIQELIFCLKAMCRFEDRRLR